MGKYFESNPTSRRLSDSAKRRRYEEENNTLQSRANSWLKSTADYFGISTDKDEYTTDYFSKRGARATELRNAGKSLWSEIALSSEFDTDTKAKLKKYFDAADTGFGNYESHYSQNPFAVKHSGKSIEEINAISKILLSDGGNVGATELVGVRGLTTPDFATFNPTETAKELNTLFDIKSYKTITEGNLPLIPTEEDLKQHDIQRAAAGYTGDSPFYYKEQDKNDIGPLASFVKNDNVSLPGGMRAFDTKKSKSELDVDKSGKVNIKDATKLLKDNIYLPARYSLTQKPDFKEKSGKIDFSDEVFEKENQAMPDEAVDDTTPSNSFVESKLSYKAWDAKNKLAFIQDPRREKLFNLYVDQASGRADGQQEGEWYKTFDSNAILPDDFDYSAYALQYQDVPLTYINEQEAAIARYIYNTEGEKAFNDYIDALTPILNSRRTERIGGDANRFADETGFMGSALLSAASMAPRLMSGTGVFEDVYKVAARKDVDVNSNAHLNAQYANAFRGAVSGELDRKYGELASNAYGVGMSIADFAYATLVSKGIGNSMNMSAKGVEALALNLQSSSAATNTIIDAKNSGLRDEDAVNLGVIAYAAEYLTEKISWEALFNNGGKSLVRYIAENVATEGAEELISQGVNDFAEFVIRKGKNHYTDLYDRFVEEGMSGTEAEKAMWSSAIKEYTTVAIGGMASGGVLGGAYAGINKIASSSSSKNLTATEEKVVRKLYEDALAEKQKEGTELNKAERDKLWDSIVEDMSKGQLKIDDIESVLGGDTYKAYQDTIKSEDAILKEFEELGKKENYTISDWFRYQKLEPKVKEIKDGAKKNEIKRQLSHEVLNVVRSDETGRLAESYKEAARRREAFKADLTKYKGKQKEAVQRAIDSGVLNDTYRSHELVNILSKIEADKGIVFNYADNAKLKESGFAVEGKTVNGFVDNKTGAVTLNIQSSKSWQSVVGHEITHVLEGTDAYDALQKALYAYAESKGELSNRRGAITELYKGMNADIDSELTADLVGDYLFTDKDFVTHLTTDRNLFQKIYDEIKYLYKVATGKEQKEIARVKKEFDKAWKELNVKPAESGQKNNTAEDSGVIKYKLNENAKTEVHKALYDKNYKGEVLIRDNTPSIMLAQKGVRDLPMVMNASHLRENIFTVDEAKKQGLRIDDSINYHGLGETLFINVLDGLDNVTEAYRGTKVADDSSRRENYFLLISTFSDANGDTINVPVYIEETALVNRMYIKTNKIATVYGKEGLRDYIKTQIKKQNLVRIKNRSNNSSESDAPIAKDYRNVASKDIIRKEDESVKKNSLSNDTDDIAPVGNFSTPLNELYYGDIAPVRKDIAPAKVATDTNVGGKSNVSDNDDIAPVIAKPSATTTAVADDIAPVVANNAITDAPIREDITPATEQKESEKLTRSTLHSNIVDNLKSEFRRKGFDFDKVLDKAKNLATFSTVDNTPQRVMEKALGYKEGQVLADLTVNKVAQNETEGIRWLNSFTDRKKGLLAQISKQYGIKPGSKESAAAQMYAEGFYVNKVNEIVEYSDAELAKDFPDAKVRNNIKGLAGDSRIRKIYDETLNAINEARTRNAYPEIQRLDNYFLHFRAMGDTFSKLGLPFNPNDIRAKDLPTDLNGVTADLKPGKPYFASEMHRTGKRTSFDLLGGLERYLTSAKNQIYHIDDIQTLRALRNYIADSYGQANGLEGLDALSEEEVQERIKQVYGSHLSTFAKFLNEEANVLAGKTALIDRGLEGIIGRRGITFLDTVNKQVGSNMVGFNISSSLTNFLPVTQTFAKSNKLDFTKAFAQTVSNKIKSMYGKGDSFAEDSPVIIRRKGAERFYRTPYQKLGDAGYVLMSAVDNISTELIARTKYNELTRKGMDSQQAHFETDKWVSRLMGDRSLGQQPQLYNSKMLGIFTKFQLEVRNQLDSMFYDTIQEAKVSNEHIEKALARNARTAAKVTSTFVQLAVVQHLFGIAFESVAGYNPAFDIISVLATVFGFDDDEESEDTVLDNVEQGFFELLEDLPYTSTFTGGRVPISSALPIKQLVTGTDEYGNDKPRWETAVEAAPYYVLPTGYGQIKKTKAGLEMFKTDEEHPIAGSYTDKGNLRFPVEDTPANRIQAGLFGQYANENAREYFDSGYAPLKAEQIPKYMASGIPYMEYRKYTKAINDIEADKDENGESISGSRKDKVIEYINNLDIDNGSKLVLIKSEYPKDNTHNEEIVNYINNREDLSYEERVTIFKELGFKVSNDSVYWD